MTAATAWAPYPSTVVGGLTGGAVAAPGSTSSSAAQLNTPAAPPTSWTAGLWAAAVLGLAGLPVNATNVQNLLMWMPFENYSSSWDYNNNPLNASLGTSASDGTAPYPNLSTAAYYTAKMLQQSNMSGIYQVLQQSGSPSAFSAAVVQSPWASSHYGVVAGGAPPQYAMPGRGLDYLTTGSPLSSTAPAANPTAGTPNDNVTVNGQLVSVWSTIGSAVAAAGQGVATGGLSWLPTVTGGAVGGGSIASEFQAAAQIATDLASGAFWHRIGVFALGAALFTVGAVVFFLSTKPGQEVTQVASMAALA